MQTSFDFSEYPAADCCPHCEESWLDGETLYCLDIRADKRERYAVFVPCCEGISEDVAASGYAAALGVSVERVLTEIGGYEVLSVEEHCGDVVCRLRVVDPTEIGQGVDRQGIPKATSPRGWQSEILGDVAEHHSHHEAPNGWKFGVAVYNGPVKVGVMVVAPPVARAIMQAHPRTAEVTRGCVLPVSAALRKNVASKLYGAAAARARAFGYDRLVTYTLAEESGHSLVAAGWTPTARSAGGSWDTPARRRSDRVSKHNVTAPKVRWEIGLTKQTRRAVEAARLKTTEGEK